MRFAKVGLLVLLLVLPSVVLAQIGTGTITGRVTDATGAVVPNVQVTVVNTETNFQYAAASNAEGLFRVQSLQPGPYRVNFEVAGFRRLVRENIEVRIGDVLPVDATLQIGNVSESVEVKDAAPLLETETSATGTVVAGNFLYKLPLHQRYVNSTLHLVPGISEGGFGYGGSLGAYHIAGQRSGAIGVFDDGVVGNDQMGGTGTVKPIQNSVAEVKVLTTALPAEYGHSAGGVINVVKKTGTNEVHGLASVFGRTRRMAHKNFFDVLTNSQPRPSAPDGVMTVFLMPDANIGGPVVLPKLYDGRNKTFFFFAHQKLIDKQVKQFPGTVPTADMKTGDFSFGGVGNPIHDPSTTRQLPDGTWTRDVFANNRIPLARFDPVARKILEIDPWVPPNATATFNAAGPVDNLIYDRKGQAYFDEYSGRIDHQFSQYVKIFGSYYYSHEAGRGRPSNIRVRDFDVGGGQGGFGSNETPFTQQNYSLGNTWIISPTFINDARVGYYRRRNDTFVPAYRKNYGQILGIPSISDELIPAFGAGNQFTPESIYGFVMTGPSRLVGETLSFRNDLTRIHGTHAFKMGYEVLRHRLNSRATNRPSGDFRFDQMTAGLQPDGNPRPRTGNTFAGFLTGYVRQALFDRELASWLPRSYVHSFYFQDDWKVSPTLTLNLGIRYTNESPYTTKWGQMSNFDPGAADDVAAGRAGGIVHPSSPLNARDNNNFQPRVGVAWHPLARWVFRGGFAVNTVDVKFPASRIQFEEYVAQVNQQRPPGDPRPLYQISRGPDPVVYNVRSNGTSGFLGTNYGARGQQWWDPNLRNPYVLNWNLSAQYEVNASYLLEVLYQASAGVGLIERWQANTFPVDYGRNDPALQAAVFRAPQNFRPFSHFGDLLVRSNFGHSTFHSGTVKVEKRYSRGLTFITFYTLSKAIDSQDTDNSGSGVAPMQNRSLEKGKAGYDRAHRLVGTVTYELPMGKGRRFLNRGGVWNHILGGYEIAWIQSIQSGNPLTFSFVNSPYNYYPTFAGDRRPDVAGKPALRDYWRDFGGDRYNLQNINPIIDMSAFAYPAAFTPGNAGRNIVTGVPLFWSVVSAQKNFRISERFGFQVRWDMQNPLKTYNFNPPTTAVDFQNPRTFGKVSGSPETASFGGAAIMNLTLKLTW